MAEQQKIIDGFLDENGKSLPVSGDAIIDKPSGKSFTEHLADKQAHLTTEAIKELIETHLKPLQTTLNTFLSGDPDDNGTLDRLKEVALAISENTANINKILEIANSGTGIAFVSSADDEPEYSGKIRMVVSNMPEPTEPSDEEGGETPPSDDGEDETNPEQGAE